MQDYLDKAPCGYLSFNDEGLITAVNSTVCELLGYTKEELKGKSLEKILTIASRIFYQTHLFPLVRLQGHLEEIFVSLLAARGQQIPVLLNAKRETDNGITKYACAFITVYHRKKFEDELVSAKKQAEKSLQESSEHQRLRKELQYHTEKLDEQLILVKKKNKELKQFNRVVTHELQEPLRKISVFTQMIVDSPSLVTNSELKEPVGKLAAATSQMHSVVSGLQQFIWLQEATLNYTDISLNTLTRNIIADAEKQIAPERIQFSSDDIPSISADAGQMHVLFEQIISNAIKFRKAGQSANITIKSTLIERNKFKVLTEKFKYDKFLKIDVSDAGIGFDAKYKDQVFELFRRLQVNEGSGVGLSLCRQIVDNHQGFIDIESKPGEGTTLTITLPLNPMLKTVSSAEY